MLLVNLARERTLDGNSFDDVYVAGSVPCRTGIFDRLRGYVGRLDLSGVVEEAEEFQL